MIGVISSIYLIPAAADATCASFEHWKQVFKKLFEEGTLR